jgi:hypothetical protein
LTIGSADELIAAFDTSCILPRRIRRYRSQRGDKMTPQTLRFVALLATIGLFSGCGNGSGNSSNSSCTGPNTGNAAILNGSTLAGADSSWAAPSCSSAQLELTTDGGFKYSLAAGGVLATAQTTWSPLGDDGLQVSCGNVLCVTSLTNISGSTCSQAFTAQVTIVSNGTSDNLGKCSFSLVSKPLP